MRIFRLQEKEEAFISIPKDCIIETEPIKTVKEDEQLILVRVKKHVIKQRGL